MTDKKPHHVIVRRNESRSRLATDIKVARNVFLEAGIPAREVNDDIRKIFHRRLPGPKKPTKENLLEEAKNCEEVAKTMDERREYDCPKICGQDDAYYENMAEFKKLAKELRQAAATL